MPKDGWLYCLWCKRPHWGSSVSPASTTSTTTLLGTSYLSYHDMEGVMLDYQPHLHGSSSTSVPFTGVLCELPKVCSRSVIKDVAPEGRVLSAACWHLTVQVKVPQIALIPQAKTLETRFIWPKLLVSGHIGKMKQVDVDGKRMLRSETRRESSVHRRLVPDVGYLPRLLRWQTKPGFAPARFLCYIKYSDFEKKTMSGFSPFIRGSLLEKQDCCWEI